MISGVLQRFRAVVIGRVDRFATNGLRNAGLMTARGRKAISLTVRFSPA